MIISMFPMVTLELKNKITAPNCQGTDVTDAWTKKLKDPRKYCSISPEELLAPCHNLNDLRTVFSCLEHR